MEYKKTTIFEKYNIEPNVEKEKLRVLFQTDPNKRKDLPVVLKIISSNELLYEEELFTTHINNESLKELNKVLEILDSTKKDYISSEIKNLSKYLINISNDMDFYKNFYYSSKINDKNAKKIFDDFLECIFTKITREFNSSIGEIDNQDLKKMYSSIASIFEKVERFSDKKKDFDEDLCDFLNNSLTLDTIGKDFTNRINAFIFLKNVIKDDFYSNSVKYIIEKMTKDYNKYGDTLIDLYEEISNAFKGKELKEVSSFITPYISTNLYLRADKSVTENKKNYKKLKKIQKCCWLYQQKKSVEDEQFDTFSELCDYFVYAGEEWITSYNDAYKAMIDDTNKDTIYNLLEIITSKLPSSEVLRVFSNVITDITGFNQLLGYILDTHQASVEHTSDKYINPKDVDDFIAKYYWLVYTNFDSNINKTFFNNIRNIGFDILAIHNQDMEILNNRYTDYGTRMLVRRKVLNTYQLFPGDWVMDDGKTIRAMFRELGETFTGYDGDSSDMIKEYDSLFKSMKKEIKSSYTCPECGFYVDEDTEVCPKCQTEIEWSENNQTVQDYDNDDDDEYEDETTTSTNYVSSSQSDNSGCLIWVIVGIVIFILLVIAANS